MPRIGILYGMENSFPSALVERINARGIAGVSAEHLRVGGVTVAKSSGFDLIVDRVSHDVDFYSAFLKNAVLRGAWVLNNPFRWAGDDKLVHYAVAARTGVAVSPTVVIPQKSHPPGTTVQSMRSLVYPLDWDEIFQHVTFPAFLKPVGRGGWMTVQRVESREEFFTAYDQTGAVCMLLQAAVAVDSLYRCYVVGDSVRVVKYERSQPQHLRYTPSAGTSDTVCENLGRDALGLCRALGYDINAVDFAVREDVPYLIDSCNPAFDADVHTVGQSNFEWIVEKMASLAIQRLERLKDADKQIAGLPQAAAARAALL